MTTHEPDLLKASDYTIKEAAAVVGCSELTIRRRIDKCRFPGAQLHRGASGDEWRIPAADLAQVADEDGWVIDLTTKHDQADDQTEDQSSDDLLEAVTGRIRAESEVDQLTKDVQSLTNQVTTVSNERDQAMSDLEYTRTELNKRDQKLTEIDKAKAVAEARTDELRIQLEKEQEKALQATQERDSLDQSHRELQKTAAEEISDLSNDLKTAHSGIDQAVGERDELTDKLTKAEASMGWWTRRRYRK